MSKRINIKNTLRKIIAWGYYYSGFYKIYHKGKIHILMYHRVLKDTDGAISEIQPGMYVTESVFESQMKYLSKHYKLISIIELLELWKNGQYSKDTKYCVVTFDDGWIDNYQNAYPILRKYEIPATIFVTTSLIGTNNWFWPEKISYLLLNQYHNILDLRSHTDDTDEVILSIINALNKGSSHDIREQVDSTIEELKKYPGKSIDNALDRIYKLLDLSVPDERVLLNWSEIQEMSNNRISFGSHTCNHTILTGVSLDVVREELESSMYKLKEQNLNFVPVFCYPNGNYDREIQTVVKECGYEAAVTTRFGFEDEMPVDYYGIRRIGVHNDISSTMPLFSFHLSGLRHGL
ncbi:MAG: polysaccharide deacetylase family protein [Gammaproteobacteria bacterium]|nr:polysaccharide deacetylase family protein [Gammaproteobacteria bacterium]MCW9006259.1 polysaccharide deacetylase family protein [Gammaproteobacteria bacterium]MCW9055055.1 polysaccharide deacetylase family protein [Gammaproteobacteria bacterium]